MKLEKLDPVVTRRGPCSHYCPLVWLSSGREHGVTAPLEAVSVTSVPVTLERDDTETRSRIIKGPSSLEDGFKLSLGPPVWRCSKHPERRAGGELASATGGRLSSTMTWPTGDPRSWAEKNYV